jgi:hypothetical protein
MPGRIIFSQKLKRKAALGTQEETRRKRQIAAPDVRSKRTKFAESFSAGCHSEGKPQGRTHQFTT